MSGHSGPPQARFGRRAGRPVGNVSRASDGPLTEILVPRGRTDADDERTRPAPDGAVPRDPDRPETVGGRTARGELSRRRLLPRATGQVAGPDSRRLCPGRRERSVSVRRRVETAPGHSPFPPASIGSDVKPGIPDVAVVHERVDHLHDVADPSPGLPDVDETRVLQPLTLRERQEVIVEGRGYPLVSEAYSGCSPSEFPSLPSFLAGRSPPPRRRSPSATGIRMLPS